MFLSLKSKLLKKKFLTKFEDEKNKNFLKFQD